MRKRTWTNSTRHPVTAHPVGHGQSRLVRGQELCAPPARPACHGMPCQYSRLPTHIYFLNLLSHPQTSYPDFYWQNLVLLIFWENVKKIYYHVLDVSEKKQSYR